MRGESVTREPPSLTKIGWIWSIILIKSNVNVAVISLYLYRCLSVHGGLGLCLGGLCQGDPQRSPRQRPIWTETPLDRDPLDRDPQTEIHLDRDPPERNPPWTETPRQRPPWTETFWTETPLDRDPTDRNPPGQRPPWTETPMDRDPHGQRPLWTETPLDRDPTGQRTPPLDRDPPPDKDPTCTVTGWWYASYWNAFLFEIILFCKGLSLIVTGDISNFARRESL